VNDAFLRYLAGLVLVAVVALAYSATRKRGVRAILADSAFCFGCMLAVVGVVAGIVYLVCVLK